MPLLLGSLRGKFIFWLAAVFLFAITVAAVAFHQVSNSIVSALGERFAEKQALYDKARIRTPLIKEVLLARKLSESKELMDWARHEDDPDLKSQAFMQLESYRHYFYDGSFSFIVHKSGHYYYNNRMGDFDGQELQYTLNRKNPADAWYYQITRGNFPYFLHVDHNQHLGLTKLWVDVPVKTIDGEILGLIRAGIPLKDFINNFFSEKETGITNILIDGSGVIQAHPDVDMIDMNSRDTPVSTRFSLFNLLNKEEDKEEFQAAIDALRLVPTQVQILPLMIQGEVKLVGIAFMPDLQWFNVTVMDMQALLGNISLSPVLLVSVFSLIFSLIAVAVVLQRFVLKRVAQLDDAARVVTGGNYDLKLPETFNDELGRLAISFNYMAKNVRDNTEKLEFRVAERTRELQYANSLLEQKNKQILDSIKYARLIQNAILPRSDVLARYLNDHLVMWLPRDVVGGDFYFLHPTEDGCFLGLVDCTGHGIPGAFMTMTAHAVIRQVLSERSDAPLIEIVKLIDERLRKTLQHHSVETQGLDYGMDIALCRLTNSQLEYVGCGIDLCYLQGEKADYIKASRFGLGYKRHARKEKALATHTINYQPDQRFYLVSDGLLDQDGGVDGFGFGRERFLQQIEQWHSTPLNEQQIMWGQLLTAYQGERTQRDDITIFGFSPNEFTGDLEI